MFKLSKNTTDGNIQKAVKRSLDFETTLVDIRKKVRKGHGLLLVFLPSLLCVCLADYFIFCR